MKWIQKDMTVVELINSSGLQEEYVVGKGVHFTLLLLSHVTKNVTITPSIRLKGSGSSATILGVIYGTGVGVATIKTLQHHEAPNTTSTLLVKSVMKDKSICLYEGGIVVDKRAQKTDAYQRNENLLLGNDAHATSKPALEILANDVRCTHGAVVKTLDTNEVWYAATRGIGEDDARSMIMMGFLSSTFDSVGDTIIREQAYANVQRLLS